MNKQIRIGSWNLCNFSKKRELNEISKVAAQFDLLAIQEVRDVESVQNLCKIIGYNYRISEPECSTDTSAHQSGKRKERYAFIWNKNISLIDEPQLISAGQYYVRSPYIAFFKGYNLDFILATIHIVWGKINDRHLEISHTQQLLNKIISHAGNERDIILCGDFNTPPEEFKLTADWHPLINATTTLPHKTGGSGSRYDNIWITKNTTALDEGVILSAGHASDHYPIYAVLKADVDLDDQLRVDLNLTL